MSEEMLVGHKLCSRKLSRKRALAAVLVMVMVLLVAEIVVANVLMDDDLEPVLWMPLIMRTGETVTPTVVGTTRPTPTVEPTTRPTPTPEG